MSEVTLRDPGPMARLEAVKADVNTPVIVFQRLCEGETLREIAKAWGVPKGQFALWFTTVHEALYESADRVRARELKEEALAIADEQAEVTKPDGSTYDPDVQRDKLRVDTRLKLMEKMDRERFGKYQRHDHNHTFDLGDRLRRARERVIEQAPESATIGAGSSAGSPAPAPEQVGHEMI